MTELCRVSRQKTDHRTLNDSTKNWSVSGSVDSIVPEHDMAGTEEMEGGSLTRLDERDLDDRLRQLSHAQLEALVEGECNNRDFDAFFEALAPVQRARAEEEQLIQSCATLARASIERAEGIEPALETLAVERAKAAEDAMQLEELHRAKHRLWKEVACAEAVERSLTAAIGRAMARAADVRREIQSGGRPAEDEERTVGAYLDAARERHRLELMLIALRRSQGQGGL